jgi:hypothetical protein
MYYEEFEHDIWESVLKVAVIENSLKETEDYPVRKELNTIQLPKHYDLTMRKLVKRYSYRQKINLIIKYSKKVASIAIIIMGIGFACLLSLTEFRAACQNVVTHIYEKYIQFDFTPDNNTETQGELELNYLPQGYSLSESSVNEYKTLLKYENNLGDIIELRYYSQNVSMYIDNEHYIVSDVKVNGYAGKFFASQDAEFENYVTWYNEQGYFCLSSTLQEETMIKIAENIK